MVLWQKITRPIKNAFLRRLANYLEQPSSRLYSPCAVPDPENFRRVLQPCDIILVEGDLRYSEFIKYVTQSTWSHCGLYIGDYYDSPTKGGEQKCIVEALLSEGTVVSPLKDYFGFNTRILRPIGLTKYDKQRVIEYALSRVGGSYDITNAMNLLKYHLPILRYILGKLPFNLKLDSDNSEQVICSSLIAQIFEHIGYPILPDVEKLKKSATSREGTSLAEQLKAEKTTLRKRHYSLFSPRDFDVSPFFSVVKPTLEDGFNYKSIQWNKDDIY